MQKYNSFIIRIDNKKNFERKHMLVCQYFYMSKQRISGYGVYLYLWGPAVASSHRTHMNPEAHHRFEDIYFHRETILADPDFNFKGTVHPKLIFHPFIAQCNVEGGFDNVSEST